MALVLLLYENVTRCLIFSARQRYAETAERPRASADALHALQPPRLGLCQVGESRPEALGDRQDHRADVEGSAGGGEGGVHGGV
jgi:hypothetical protein